jgi:EpsI family protein
VALAISAVIAVFGLQWARVLAFPLAVLLFAVPVGDAFVPALMDWTADFTVAALKASSVPVLREGNHITIPSGRWSVVEACSGARYLLASFMVGTLYAWFMYRSPVRRAAFMVASLIVPIVANWFRAYAIVMLGHLSSNKLATGVDHFIYGWVFFGLFVFAMFAVGLRWRQDQSLDLELPVAAARFNGGSPPALATAGAAAFVLAAAWPALAALLLSFVDARPLSPVLIEAQSGWMPADEADDGWRPQLAAPRAERWQAFQRNGQRVNVHIGYFRGQSQLSELVNSEHRLVLAEGDDWRVVAGGISTALLAAREVTVRSALLQNARGRYIRIWQWYWLGERNTSSDVLAKVDLALDRLLLRSDASAWIAVATTHDPERPDYSDRVLREFVAGMSATIHEALKATAER